jgi:hypothetical protein
MVRYNFSIRAQTLKLSAEPKKVASDPTFITKEKL